MCQNNKQSLITKEFLHFWIVLDFGLFISIMWFCTVERILEFHHRNIEKLRHNVVTHWIIISLIKKIKNAELGWPKADSFRLFIKSLINSLWLNYNIFYYLLGLKCMALILETYVWFFFMLLQFSEFIFFFFFISQHLEKYS